VDFQTAVAQAEVEDRQLAAAFHHIRFGVEGGESFVVATTRPELLPACVAIVAHPKDQRYEAFFGKRAGPVYDLPTTMAKLMALGFTLNQVVEMATVNAARLLGRLSQLGSLRIAEPADISVLRVEDREWKAVDSQKGTIPAHQAIVPVYAVRGDTVYEPLAIERP
jgi:hypothetical protein